MNTSARTSRPIPEIQDDWRYLDENRQLLMETHPDRLVVIFRGEAFSAETYAELEQILRKQNLLNASPVIEFLSTNKLPLRLVSSR